MEFASQASLQSDQQPHKVYQDIPIDIHQYEQKYEPAAKTPCLVCFNESDDIMEFDSERHDICRGCFIDFLKTEITSAKVQEIKCPHCNHEVNEDLIQSLVPGNIWNKYLKFKLNLSIIHDPMARWCPKPDCVNIIRLKTAGDTEAQCINCNTTICTNCNREVHPGTSCDKLMKEEMKNWGHDKDLSKCPKCRMLVEKVDGCNHMTCSSCTYEFCWLCDSAYTKYHYHRWNPFGCPGLQSGYNRARTWSTTKRVLFRIAYTIGMILLIPLVLLLWFPINFVERIFQRSRLHRRNCCCQMILGLLLFIVGLLLNAIVMPLLILYGVPALIYHLFVYLHIRYKLHKRTTARLKLKKEKQQQQQQTYDVVRAAPDNQV